MEEFLIRHDHSGLAQQVAEENRKEIELYKRYHEFFSYGFYIARKV
jgi:hypothetical protein